MKKYLILLLLLAGSFIKTEAAGIDSLRSLKTKAIIKEVQQKYAPDRRTAVFTITVSANDTSVLELETTIPEAFNALREKFKQENIGLRVNEKLLPSKDLGDETFGISNLSVCNNRFDPDNGAEMATQVILGTPVRILKKEHGYYLVQSPDRYIAWTDDAGITKMNEQRLNEWLNAEKVVYTAEYGHAYEKASLKSMPVSDLVAGNILKFIGKEHQFYKVAYPDGRIGFIPKKSGMFYKNWVSRPNPTAEDILTYAKMLNGVPYLWGGTSIKGVDCSGFTKTCYFLNGIIIPRDASQQALVGEKVDIYENDTVNINKCLKNLQAGDLMFFAAGKYKRPNAKITHTAIYMGNGEFIQSAGSVGINSIVSTSNIFDSFGSRTLVCARRILNSIGTAEISRIDQHPFYKPSSK